MYYWTLHTRNEHNIGDVAEVAYTWKLTLASTSKLTPLTTSDSGRFWSDINTVVSLRFMSIKLSSLRLVCKSGDLGMTFQPFPSSSLDHHGNPEPKLTTVLFLCWPDSIWDSQLNQYDTFSHVSSSKLLRSWYQHNSLDSEIFTGLSDNLSEWKYYKHLGPHNI